MSVRGSSLVEAKGCSFVGNSASAVVASSAGKEGFSSSSSSFFFFNRLVKYLYGVRSIFYLTNVYIYFSTYI